MNAEKVASLSAEITKLEGFKEAYSTASDEYVRLERALRTHYQTERARIDTEQEKMKNAQADIVATQRRIKELYEGE